MRDFSPAEVTVVQQLLAGPGAGLGPLAPVPRRTRYHVMRRLHERGIVQTRAVPDPAALGRPRVILAIAEAFSERRQEVATVWQSQPETVHLWCFHETLFGIFSARNDADSKSLNLRLNPDGALRTVYQMDCDSRRATLPVWFDYEGAWARIVEAAGVYGYPHSMPSSTASQRDTPPQLSRGDRAAIDALLDRFCRGQGVGGTSDRLLPVGRRARDLRLQKDGLVVIREILDPVACGRYAPSFYRTLVVARGGLNSEGTPEGFFVDLVRNARLCPFLYASSGREILFAFLTDIPSKVSPKGRDAPTPTAEVVRRHLHEVVVARADLASVETPVNHQYNRAFLASG